MYKYTNITNAKCVTCADPFHIRSIFIIRIISKINYELISNYFFALLLVHYSFIYAGYNIYIYIYIYIYMVFILS